MAQQSDNPTAPVYQPGFFAEFSPPSYEQWRQAAEKALKGAPFEKLFTRTYEGITLKPIYTRDDWQGLAHLDSLPGQPPFVRHRRALGYLDRPWLVCQENQAPTPDEANRLARYELERGLTALNLVLDTPTLQGRDPGEDSCQDGLSLATVADLERLLEGIDLSRLPLHLPAGAGAVAFLGMITAYLEGRGLEPSLLQGLVGADPLGELARDGELSLSLEAAYDQMAAAVSWAAENAPRLQTVFADTSPYHQAGAHAAQELGLALAAGSEYLRALLDRGVEIDTAAGAIRFGFSLGSHFFMEIAKLRAARLLWDRVVECFGGGPAARAMRIHGRTSSWTKTCYDPYVNLLRNTTEAFAAAVGGLDSLHVTHFDEAVRPADNFSRRISRNLQAILQEECHLTIPIDPAGGSYLVEALTDQLAQKGWEFFQELERAGGLAAALGEGLPQKACAETAAARARNLAVRKDVLVGINLYPNLEERPLEPHEIDYPALAAERAQAVAGVRPARQPVLETPSVPAAAAAFAQGHTLGQVAAALGYQAEASRVRPLAISRAAADYERLRRNAEQYLARNGRRVPVFLANLGPVPQHKPRADFATGFFQVGGFAVINSPGFDDPRQAARAALDSGAPIVVICSSDAAYPQAVPPLCRAIKAERPETIVILAGKPAPEQEEAYRAAGLDDYIFIRSDCLAMLTELQKRTGVVS